MTITLYELTGGDETRPFSPHCWKVVLALAHKGLDFDRVAVPFTAVQEVEDHFGKTVPVLRDDDRVLADSFDIALYLDEAYPDRPSLFGGGAGPAYARFVEAWALTQLHTAIGGRLLLDIYKILEPEDQIYFRHSRETRFGKTLEQVVEASQQKAEEGISSGRLAEEIVPVRVPQRKGDPIVVDTDEHPRAGSTIEGLAKLRSIVRQEGTITAGNASGINDGACALLLASDDAVKAHGLEPMAEVVAWASAGVEPRIMGIGPVPASRKVLEIADLYMDKIDVIELNEAFAAQGLAVLRELGVDESADHVNPNGGAIALGHPLGMSGARLVTTACLLYTSDAADDRPRV